MKRNIIIIHGAHAVHSNRLWVQEVISWVYKNIFNFIPRYSHTHPWVASLQTQFHVIQVDWSGNVVPYDIPLVAKRVAKILKDNPDQHYIFLTKSIGAEIAFQATEIAQSKNVSAMLSICPVNKPRAVNDFPVIFFSSASDIFASYARVFLWPLSAWRTMTGKITEKKLAHARHDQFIPTHITTSGKTFLQVIVQEIKRLPA